MRSSHCEGLSPAIRVQRFCKMHYTRSRIVGLEVLAGGERVLSAVVEIYANGREQ